MSLVLDCSNDSVIAPVNAGRELRDWLVAFSKTLGNALKGMRLVQVLAASEVSLLLLDGEMRELVDSFLPSPEINGEKRTKRKKVALERIDGMLK